MICTICGKSKWDHQAKTNNCPIGPKTRIGYINFDPNNKYTKLKNYNNI